MKKITFTALFAALIFATTVSVRFPTPGAGGYVHPGDAMVILSGLFLGPAWGFWAAGIGSALADVLGGYIIYIPVTFAIKGLVALIAGLALRAFRRHLRPSKILPAVFGGIADVVLVSGGYFLYETPFFGLSAAVLSLPANLIQSASGFAIAVILYPILISVPTIRNISDEIFFCKQKK